MSLLQQKTLVAASRLISVQSVGLDWSPPSEPPECNWLYEFFIEHEVDNSQEMRESDANVTFFVSGYIGRSIGRRRKCEACKDILLVDRDNEIFLSDYVPQDYTKLFDDADRGSLAVPTKFCFALTAIAVQCYNAISSDNTIKERLLSSSNQRLIFASSILKVIAFSGYKDLLNQKCAKNHCNFKFILQSAYNCFAKNELKRLNSRSGDPPVKMARNIRKLSSKTLKECCK